ncbi:GNAT family N-acetyltransferase [Rhizobiales bacterium]|uniref:GNAT family N-acetyltransferase n=1 Tax=Hongsoonwoonella zoysiae TaxID=2821844 RepID=UPI0015609AE2|nr:GNAT family N-acetyltransferase [Hongsoonwoonella zoysiae]NRG16577.1 GNAT family N-acetyltransferase [Hongsoonwoonella zoysiae]
MTEFLTTRLRLRPRCHSDLEDCLAMDRDPLVTRFVAGPWGEPDAHRAFVLERMSHPYPPGMGYWTILDRKAAEGEAFLGWILLLPVESEENAAEIGWRLARQCWGRGIAPEAALPVLRYALETLKVSTVVAEIHPQNAASIAVAEKIGLRFVGQTMADGAPAKSYRLSSN